MNTDLRDLPIPAIAEALGITRRMRKWGPCPACRADRTKSDTRPPMILGHGDRSWTCYACGEHGDAIDLISWALLGRRGREAGEQFSEVLAWLNDRRIVVEPTEYEPAPLVRPEPSTLLDAFRTSTPLAKTKRMDVLSFCALRGYDPAKTPAGVIRRDFDAPFWPRYYSETWPLIVPAVDASGTIQGIHGRAVTTTAPRKSTWPRDVNSRGLIFADPTHARPWLRGKGPAPARLFVCEGITDYLSACSSSPGSAVVGIESGSAPAFRDMPWERGMRVYLATDLDEAGDRYLTELVNAIPAGVLAVRVRPRRAA